MSKTTPSNATKRIAIAIELGQPYVNHHGCYRGIVQYVREHHPDWLTIVDPFLTGLGSRHSRNRYDGIVGRISDEVAQRAREYSIPVVNHWMNSPATDLPGVFTDYKACGRIVADHFIRQGYRRITLVSWETDRAQALYYAGLQEQAQSQGVELSVLNVPYFFEDYADLFAIFYQLLREALQAVTSPVGMYVPMEGMAIYVLQLCQELGLRVPHDVGLAVTNNSLEICLNTQPTLTAIQTNDIKVGYCAMQLLDQLMAGQAPPSNSLQFIEPKVLRVRGSSEVHVSEDPVVAAAMRFISDNTRKVISIDDVAAAAKVSKRTLSRRFEEFVGQSVHSEISRIRAMTIKQILIDTDLPLSEVADACGFASTSHFNAFFRKVVGKTPGEYRRENKA